jgi:hypothetical protein
MVNTHIRAAVCIIAFAAAGCLATAASAQSVMKQCGDKWQAAKAANQVPAGMTWPKFLSQCRADLASQQQAPAAAAPAPTVPNPMPAPAAPKPAPAPAPTQTTTTTAPSASGGATAQHSRIKQCGAEWRANKATLQPQYGSWPKYWSACDKRLKAAGQ